MMKIDNSGKPLNTVTPTSTKTSNLGRAYGNAPTTGTKDSATVSINPLASQLQTLEAKLGQEPAVDSQRVSEIRQAIREGRFSINPEAIADKLMDDVKELLADRK